MQGSEGSLNTSSLLSDYNKVPDNVKLPRASPLAFGSEESALDVTSIKIIFVLGGPGAGKGTQCNKLVKYFNSHDGPRMLHLSAGDLLRAEQTKEESPFAAIIKERIIQGTIVPMQITISLLKNAIKENLLMLRGTLKATTSNFLVVLIDGFPRAVDQGLEFEAKIAPSVGVLCLECSHEAMLKRIIQRGTSSGRDDDNHEAAIKRFETYEKQTRPVIDYLPC